MMNAPAQIASNYVAIGKGKVNTPIPKMFVLAILAGMFIAFGGVGASTASAVVDSPSLAKLVSGVVFPGGLTMVLLAGSELFTGNCLIIIPVLQKEVSVGGMLKNWVVVWCGNLVGGLFVAWMCAFGHQLSMFSNSLAVSEISTAVSKCSLSFSDAFIKGIACNFLVCIAVWISFAGKTVVDKIIGLFFPIMIFVTAGFEHSVANMYYIGVGLFAKMNPTYADAAAEAGVDLTNLTWGKFFVSNLLPVTLGNIVGGAVLVGVVYWFCYLQGKKED